MLRLLVFEEIKSENLSPRPKNRPRIDAAINVKFKVQQYLGNVETTKSSNSSLCLQANTFQIVFLSVFPHFNMIQKPRMITYQLQQVHFLRTLGSFLKVQGFEVACFKQGSQTWDTQMSYIPNVIIVRLQMKKANNLGPPQK